MKKVKIYVGEKKKLEKNLDTNSLLIDIRKELLDSILFPYIFLDDEEKEIEKDKENVTKLKDILDGKNLHLKKEIIKRKMLGEFKKNKDGIDYYIYPKINLDIQEKQYSSNIMIIGETGVGKSTWIHCFINYMQSINIEENNRYLLFDEEKLQQEYEKTNKKKKPLGSSITDKLEIYDIKGSVLYNNPIRLIDTPGFGDTRGEKFDEGIVDDIKNLFESSKIDTLHAICIIFKGNETRSHDRTKSILSKLFSLFGKDLVHNIIIIFTFTPDINNIQALTTLKDESSPFHEILGNIDNLNYFAFENEAYFSNNKEKYEDSYETNTLNFARLLQCIFNLKPISLEASRKVIDDRKKIKNKSINLSEQLISIMQTIDTSAKNQKEIMQLYTKLNDYQKRDVPLIEKEIEIPYYEEVTIEKNCSSGYYVLYCNYDGIVCHRYCKGPKEGWNSDEYGCDVIYTFGGHCSNCGCNWSKHSFKTSYSTKEQVKKIKKEKTYEPDPNAQQDEKEKDKIRAELNNEINKNKNKINSLKSEINKGLKKGFELLYQLAIINNELDDKALTSLKKDKKKYEYTKKILEENMQGSINKDIINLFITALNNIENIHKNQDYLENEVKKIETKISEMSNL